jgi:hypothetical protein
MRVEARGPVPVLVPAVVARGLEQAHDPAAARGLAEDWRVVVGDRGRGQGPAAIVRTTAIYQLLVAVPALAPELALAEVWLAAGVRVRELGPAVAGVLAEAWQVAVRGQVVDHQLVN